MPEKKTIYHITVFRMNLPHVLLLFSYVMHFFLQKAEEDDHVDYAPITKRR